MLKVEVDIYVERSPEEVFEFISNFENNPIWQNGMQECTFTSEPPLGVGSTYQQVAQFLGRRIESDFEVIEYEAGKMVKAATVESSFPITFQRWVEPQDGGTRVQAIITGDSSGFFRIAEPLMAWMTRRSINADYARLKEVLEEGN